MRLNGWQRLWILISIIYLISILVVYIFFIRQIFRPDEVDNIYRSWYNELYSYAVINGDDEFKSLSPADFKNKYNMEDERLIVLIESKLNYRHHQA